MKFETALRMRNAAYRKFLIRERQCKYEREKVQALDDKCNDLRDWNKNQKWEPKFPRYALGYCKRSCNFSGMED